MKEMLVVTMDALGGAGEGVLRPIVSVLSELESVPKWGAHLVFTVVAVMPLLLRATVLGALLAPRARVPEIWNQRQWVHHTVTLRRTDWRGLHRALLSHFLSRGDFDIVEAHTPDEWSAVLILRSKVSLFWGCYFVKIHLRCPPGSSETTVWAFAVPAVNGVLASSVGLW